MNIFEDPSLLLNYYGVQAAEFRMRHDAIFSEIKHYSSAFVDFIRIAGCPLGGLGLG
jgi:hypothetical protein